MVGRYAQICFIASNYSRLQGLRAIPLGMLVVFVSVWAIYNHGPSADFTTLTLAVIGTFLLDRLTDRYYERAFGHVKPLPSKRRDIIASVVVGVFAILAFGLDTAHLLQVNVLGLIFSVCFLEPFWRVDRSEWKKIFTYFPENTIAAILIAIISILPLFGVSVWEIVGIHWRIVGVVLIFGIVIILTGVTGHIRVSHFLTK